MLDERTVTGREQRKIERSSSEAKLIRIGAERRKSFPCGLEKETNRLFFPYSGRENRTADANLVRKQSRGSGHSKEFCPALISCIEGCDKHLKTPKKLSNRPNGHQQQLAKVSVFSLFYSQKFNTQSKQVIFCNPNMCFVNLYLQVASRERRPTQDRKHFLSLQ